MPSGALMQTIRRRGTAADPRARPSIHGRAMETPAARRKVRRSRLILFLPEQSALNDFMDQRPQSIVLPARPLQDALDLGPVRRLGRAARRIVTYATGGAP